MTFRLPRNRYPCLKIVSKKQNSIYPTIAPTRMPSSTETGIFRKSETFALPPCAMPVKVVNSTIT